MTTHPPKFTFDNTYARELRGFYVPWEGAKVPSPQTVLVNDELARELKLDPAALATSEGAANLSGSHSPDGAAPLAQVYAGHQFGGFSPQLGDGRAILLGEIIDTHGKRRDLHLKGSGRTPFSRGGDGKAVIGPVLREYIVGEAMYALGIPTTRALAATTTGEDILREGHKPGAVLARVASSHIRVGTFQFFAARGETDKVRQLADYTIARHDPDLADDPDKYLKLLSRVISRQAELIAKWVLVGFVHGVMNTDNMTISGETIDYGPCAFLDNYDPDAVFSSIDEGGRYAYGKQPVLAQWNLARLAECLVPLINAEDQDDAVRQATNALNTFPALYQDAWLRGMRVKLGLATELEQDIDLANALTEAMKGQDVDYTSFFRQLAAEVDGEGASTRALFKEGDKFDHWFDHWKSRLQQETATAEEISNRMNAVNPIYIPRNHKVEEALAAAENGNYERAQTLVQVLKDPFTEREGLEAYAKPAPKDFGPYRTFCGT